ncbi:MAG: NusG domain II-containing protein [Bacilli bacterium]|nr:NusG domain II-containing protein [Bacilli bacterium]
MSEEKTEQQNALEEKKPSFWRKHLWDAIVISVAAVLAGGLSIWIATPKASEGHIAQISVSGKLIRELDLSKEAQEERVFLIQGAVSEMSVGVKYNAIRVVESSCPSQYCVNEGYISEPGRPIVCAYNQVVIEIVGQSESDVVIG